jgi:plasmid stabilization system protein ParE
MAELIVSPLAKADMREIGDYISRELRNPDAALRMLGRLKKAMLPLHDFPEMGAPLLVSGKQSVPYRYLVCGQYLIFYHLEAERVLVDRVLFGRRDYMALLFGNQLEDEQ